MTELVPTPQTEFSMIQQAIDKGLDPDTIKKLVDLETQLRAIKAKKEFAVSMNACQQSMPTVLRQKKNTQTGKMYAPVEDVQAVAKPQYVPQGFTLFFTSEPGQTPETTTVHLDVHHVSGHTERCTLPNCPFDDKGPKGGDVKTKIQGLKSSLSYAKGILICMAFNITVADEDSDGQAQKGMITQEQIVEINTLCDQYCEGKPEADVSAFFRRFNAWMSEALGREVSQSTGLEVLTEQVAFAAILFLKNAVKGGKK